jgi:hypothetical protein
LIDLKQVTEFIIALDDLVRTQFFEEGTHDFESLRRTQAQLVVLWAQEFVTGDIPPNTPLRILTSKLMHKCSHVGQLYGDEPSGTHIGDNEFREAVVLHLANFDTHRALA